ncbi:uncharacterized protein L3040_008269 [Drepanopeziza brunnea f. sp. 'multigermtubi']|uniref:uncharacterized protein n=1 Tax=Drepanopeziza brunnea f. sp. 'multigermtubi' TaxID=698441 RepID=UPI00239634B7|nr:hypothetical protein L3040_008269 [Drepanopeziza brunnea f. sp. 'multigermtubi']
MIRCPPKPNLIHILATKQVVQQHRIFTKMAPQPTPNLSLPRLLEQRPQRNRASLHSPVSSRPAAAVDIALLHNIELQSPPGLIENDPEVLPGRVRRQAGVKTAPLAYLTSRSYSGLPGRPWRESPAPLRARIERDNPIYIALIIATIP